MGREGCRFDARGPMNQELKDKIDALSRIEMARLHRFAPSGARMFQGEAGRYFAERFKSLGGMSPAISKKIGLDR